MLEVTTSRSLPQLLKNTKLSRFFQKVYQNRLMNLYEVVSKPTHTVCDYQIPCRAPSRQVTDILAECNI